MTLGVPCDCGILPKGHLMHECAPLRDRVREALIRSIPFSVSWTRSREGLNPKIYCEEQSLTPEDNNE